MIEHPGYPYVSNVFKSCLLNLGEAIACMYIMPEMVAGISILSRSLLSGSLAWVISAVESIRMKSLDLIITFYIIKFVPSLPLRNRPVSSVASSSAFDIHRWITSVSPLSSATSRISAASIPPFPSKISPTPSMFRPALYSWEQRLTTPPIPKKFLILSAV